jgi:hypothetical protein
LISFVSSCFAGRKTAFPPRIQTQDKLSWTGWFSYFLLDRSAGFLLDLILTAVLCRPVVEHFNPKSRQKKEGDIGR